ncbi:Transposase IS200 like protein [Stieleria maiorica]|uniref:Transposase IS200 like protein n=1 Tax=Stieleria maiorica TaxID=2795974 RepID=A0A5B9MIX3_9BACT|nr:IS200/IS605 family transposase [Stieleria maiorica]QEF99594.1 Transposase IS200 like protein [Stieleria maiorica]
MSHHQLLYHIVFSVKERRRYLSDKIRDDVFSYMSGVAKNLGGNALNINGFYDHAHLLARIPTKVCVADFVGRVKSNTSKHINDNKWCTRKFQWQDGYGAFTVSSSMRQAVFDYIDKQMQHHARRNFEDEYLSMLKNHGIEYDPRYVFD